MLVRYINVCFKMSLFLTFWGLVVLAPVYGNAQDSNFSWNKYTLANIPNNPSAHQLWVPAIFAYIFSTYFCHLMYGEYRNFVTKRIQYLVRGDGDTPTQTYYTLMIEKVPITLRSAPALEAFFENLFPNDIHSVEVALDLKDLDMMTDQRRRVRDNLEKSIALFKATGKLQTEWIKKDFHQECYPLKAVAENWIAKLLGFIIVDAIDHRTRVLAELNSLVKTLQLATFEQRQKLDEQETKRKQNIHGKMEAHVSNNMRKILNINLPSFLSQKSDQNESPQSHKEGKNTKIKRESENCGVGLLYDDESKCASLLSSDCLLSPVAFFSAVDYDHTSTRARSPSGLNCMSWRDTCLQYETEEIKHCYDFSDMTLKPSINPIRNSAPNSSMTGTGTGRGTGGGGGGEAEVVKRRDERQGQKGKDFGFSGNEGNKDANKGKLIGTGLMKEIKEEEGGGGGGGRGGGRNEAQQYVERNCDTSGKLSNSPVKERGSENSNFRKNSSFSTSHYETAKLESYSVRARTEGGIKEGEKNGGEMKRGIKGERGQDSGKEFRKSYLENENQNENQNGNEDENGNNDCDECSMGIRHYTLEFLKSVLRIGQVVGIGLISFGKEGLRTSSVGVRGLLRTLLEGIRTVELLTVGACYKTSSTAFVTLKSRVGTSSAHQLFLSHVHYSMIVKSAPNPKDCIWSNISIPARQIEMRKTIADSCLIVGAVFWSIVVGFITAVANLESISKELPWLNAYRNTIIYEVLNQYLAVALLLILLSILPFIFDLIARSYEGRKLESEIQNSIMTRYFYYQLANVFVSVGLGSIANSVHQIIQNPSSILSILGTSLPSLSVYFTNLLIVKTFTAVPLEILRIWPLICVLSVRSCQDKNKCTIRELKRGRDSIINVCLFIFFQVEIDVFYRCF